MIVFAGHTGFSVNYLKDNQKKAQYFTKASHLHLTSATIVKHVKSISFFKLFKKGIIENSIIKSVNILHVLGTSGFIFKNYIYSYNVSVLKLNCILLI